MLRFSDLFRTSVLIGCAVLAMACERAMASDESIRQLQQPVDARRPSDFVAEGHYFKGFLFKPALEVEQTYNDNIYIDNAQEVDDFVTYLRPSLGIVKDYDRSVMKLNLEAQREQHISETQENNMTGAASFIGATEVTSHISIPYSVKVQKSKQSRSTPGEISQTAEPLNKNILAGSLGVRVNFNRLTLTLSGEAARSRFESGTSRATGEFLDFQKNNLQKRGASLLATYNVLAGADGRPEHTLFADMSYETQTYDSFVQNDVNTADSKNNKVMNILAGVITDYKGIVYGTAGIGYEIKNYEAAGAKTIGNIDYYLDLKYSVTPKMTILLSGSRAVDQENDYQRGLRESVLSIGTDYEFAHNLYGGAALDIQNTKFIESGQTNETLSPVLNMRYLHSRYLESELEFRRTDRSSDNQEQEYLQNVFLYRLTAKM